METAKVRPSESRAHETDVLPVSQVREKQYRNGSLVPFPDRRRPAEHAGGLLSSWKQIATYLSRGVRTVQRWEETLQLPVHRVGSDRGPVFAYECEIDGWLRRRASEGLILPSGVPVAEPAQSNPPDRLTRFVKELRRTTLRLEQRVAKSPSDLTMTEALFALKKLVDTLFAEEDVEGVRARVHLRLASTSSHSEPSASEWRPDAALNYRTRTSSRSRNSRRLTRAPR